MRFNINISKIVLYLVLIGGVSFGWTVCINTGRLPEFFYLDSNVINIENLMFYTWQVQVTISLISISLTSLIIGNLETRIYGQSIKSILMITNKFQMNYIEKIVLVILLSVINLWSIMYNSLSVLIVIFIFSIIGMLDLILDSFNILFNPNKYESKVKKYINRNIKCMLDSKENDLDEIIKNIRMSNKVLIESGNIIEADLNNKYLFEILREITNTSVNVTTIINSIEETIIVSIKLLSNNNYVEECIAIINQLLNEKLDSKYKNWILEAGLNELINKAKENASHETYKKISEYLLYDIFSNINFENINQSIISTALYRYFYWIYNNDTINNFVKRQIVLSFVNQLVPSQFENFNDDKYKDEYNIRKSTVYKISKMFIENNDKELFGELVKSMYSNNEFSLNLDKPNKNYEIIITISIYLYYIIAKEKACEEKFKEIVKGFVYQKVKNGTKYDRNIKDLVNQIGIHIWDSYESIKKEMPMAGWEYMPSGAAKCIIMDSVINEYFLFYSIVNIEYYDYEEYINNKFNLNHCYKVLEYYDNNGMLKNTFIGSFKEYLKIYNNELDYDNIKTKIRIIYDITNKLYAKLVIEQEKSYYNMQIVKDNIKKLKSNIVNNIKKSDKYIYTDFEDLYFENINYKKDDISTAVLAKKVQLLGSQYEDIVISDIWNGILNIIGSIGYKFEINYKDDNKIKSLLSFIDNSNLEVNSIVNKGLNSNWFLKYNEKDDDKLSLQKFEEGLNKIKIDNSSNYTLLLKEHDLKVYIKLEGICIKEISQDEIEKQIKRYKIDENQYQVNITNDIYTVFTEKQIIEYFKYKFKVIEIKIKVKHNIKENEVIEIRFNK